MPSCPKCSCTDTADIGNDWYECSCCGTMFKSADIPDQHISDKQNRMDYDSDGDDSEQ